MAPPRGRGLDVDFQCPPFRALESITLAHGFDDVGTHPPFYSMGDTMLYDGGTAVPEQPAIAETLAIRCETAFPWDVNGDDVVSGGDIAAVVIHFGVDLCDYVPAC